jgi:hypothetical protein
MPGMLFGEIAWHQGSIVLSSDSVLTGKLSVEEKYDIVLFSCEGRVDVYPAHKVRSVFFYDTEENINRKFISIQQKQLQRSFFRLYEIVILGEISLLRRSIFEDKGSNADHDGNGFQYLVRYQNKLTSLKQFRSKIYPDIKISAINDFEQYVRRNRLNPNIAASAIRIIQYYNHQFAAHRLSMN